MDVFENNEGLSDVLYRIVKQAYQVDITHHGTECLGFVSAESKNEAVKQICATIVSGIYSEGSAKLYGSLPSASKSLERAGLIAYGSVYIEKYKDELGDDYIFYKELFGSLKQFHEVMYDRYRNEQVDRLSKVSAELNQNVSAMTKAVVVMTVISLMVAMSDIVVNEHGWISGAAYVLATILLSANVLLVMFTYSKKDHINTSSCSDSDGMSIQGFVAIIIALISMLGALAFFIYYSISLIDILVNEFLFLTLLYNIMPYASKNDY